MAEADRARVQRAEICDLLSDCGPDQPTLCAGWNTRDLAAHLVARERRPLAAPGLVLAPLSGYTERVRRSVAARPFPDLVAALRRPPWWSPLRPQGIDQLVNLFEFFIHHEDIRRAQPEWEPRALPAGLGHGLWVRLRSYARIRLRRFPATVVLESPGYGRIQVGATGEEIRVLGDPGELVMFLTGRQRAARVDVNGPSTLADRLSRAKLGL